MAATKLTKTQREVLEQAARNPKGRVGVHAWTQHSGSPSSGRQKSEGLRKHAAIVALVDMGLLDSYSVHHHSGYAPGGEYWGGWKIYSTEATAFITEEGKKAIQ